MAGLTAVGRRCVLIGASYEKVGLQGNAEEYPVRMSVMVVCGWASQGPDKDVVFEAIPPGRRDSRCGLPEESVVLDTCRCWMVDEQHGHQCLVFDQLEG